MKTKILLVHIVFLLLTTMAWAENSEQKISFDSCILSKVKSMEIDITVGQIKEMCLKEIFPKTLKIGAISKRVVREREDYFNPYTIIPHKKNYMLPASFTSNINKEAYSHITDYADNFNNVEAKYQLSIKVPLLKNDLFFEYDQIFVAITLQSWWQIYASGISKPFRETNYQPEITYLTPTSWHPFGGNLGVGIGLEHQSNGRSQLLSRSWNRLYGLMIFEKGNFVMAFRPWYRLPEDKKLTLNAAEGDDNPDILDYMGRFELRLGYKWENLEFTSMTRQNFSTNKGAIELGLTFPLYGRMLGYVQYFNGYGESLIDYNHYQQRLGIGLALTNAF